MRIFQTLLLATVLSLGQGCASGGNAGIDRDRLIGTASPCETESAVFLLVAAGQISPTCEARVAGHQFTFAVDQAGLTSYVSTDEPAFTTPEGVAVGSTLDQVLGAGGSPVIAEPGWGYYSRLESGWAARFPGVPGGSGDPPTPDARVVALFLR